jgi:nitric oxide reductase subunit B
MIAVSTKRPARRPMVLSPLWLQGAILTFVVGFAILAYLAIRIYRDHAPIPARITTEAGETFLTGEEIRRGQEHFLTYGLMEYGTVYGHGAYLGPDFTADYLHRAAVLMEEHYGGGRAAADRMRDELRANRYDPKTGTLSWTEGQVFAFEAIHRHLTETLYDREASGAGGIGPHMIADAGRARQVTAFIAWTAWTATARRPGRPFSYTNNWPPDEAVGNTVTGEAIVWSALSLVALLGGIGIVFALYGRYAPLIGWHESEERRLRFVPPADVPLTPAQRTTAWYFLVVAALFVLQNVLGVLTVHYRVEPAGFFGFDLPRVLPYNLTRTWHVQLTLFFVAAAYLAAGIFLAPLIAGREPKGQAALSAALLGALVVVVVGSMAGEALSYRGLLPEPIRPVLGAQGWEYLDLGKFWMALLVAGLVLWVVILFRGLRPALAAESRGNLPWLFFYGAATIPLFYAVGLVNRTQTPFAIADFWRFWVVHLWVEDFLELFTTMMVAYIFVLLGVVSERLATRLIYFEVILYSLGGVVGTMHHVYFSGAPAVHMALGAFFSAAEVIPLTLLTVEAWTFLQLGGRQQVGAAAHRFPHRWAVLFLASVGFWNFLGAGIFGFLINLPVVSFYQIGTYLTSNHGHAAMMGVYGMLALALMVFCLRYLVRPEDWSERLVGYSFWTVNVGLLLMVAANLFPVGILQLADVVTHGYWHARSEFSARHRSLEWMRLPGDLVFVSGTLPLLWVAARAAVRPRASAAPADEAGVAVEAPLFTLVQPGGRPETVEG